MYGEEEKSTFAQEERKTLDEAQKVISAKRRTVQTERLFVCAQNKTAGPVWIAAVLEMLYYCSQDVIRERENHVEVFAGICVVFFVVLEYFLPTFSTPTGSFYALPPE